MEMEGEVSRLTSKLKSDYFRIEMLTFKMALNSFIYA